MLASRHDGPVARYDRYSAPSPGPFAIAAFLKSAPHRKILVKTQRTLFDLLGPMIDPIGYQIELETYVAKIMRGRANLYVTLVGYIISASMFFHFFVDPHKALTVSFFSWQTLVYSRATR